MNNLELCGGKAYALSALWAKREKIGLRDAPQHERLCGGQECPKLTKLIWACASPDTALGFDIGDLVIYSDGVSHHHAVVESYVTDHYVPVEGVGGYICYDKLVLLLADGRKVPFEAYRLKKSDIPKEILDLVKSRIVASLQCPLAAKSAGKEAQ